MLLVVLFHARAPFARGGYIGVDIFFVLSGYLISGILLHELNALGRIDLLRFYMRRFLRLAPALLLMLVAYVVASPFLWPANGSALSEAAIAAAYLSDYAVAFWNTPDLLSHTWSLAVEEHFYLVWPLLLAFAFRRWDRNSLITVLAAAYVIANLLRWFFIIRGQSWEQVYYRFDTRLSGLILGSLLAALRLDAQRFARLVLSAPAMLWGVVLLGIVCLHSQWGDLWMLTWGITSAELYAFVLILAVQVPRGQVTAMFSFPPLVALGKISYGVCLWHYPIFRWLRPRYHWDEVLLIGLPLSVALAAASYFTVEAWCRRKKKTGISARVARPA